MCVRPWEIPTKDACFWLPNSVDPQKGREEGLNHGFYFDLLMEVLSRDLSCAIKSEAKETPRRRRRL